MPFVRLPSEKIKDYYPLRFFFLGFFAAFGFRYVAIKGGSSHGADFPLDDAWIHLSVAREFFGHHIWGLWDSGKWSACSTSPLWDLALGACNEFLGGGNPKESSNILIFLSFLTANSLFLATWRAGKAFVGMRTPGLFAALLVISNWHILWAANSGMETLAFACAALMVIGSVSRAKPQAAAVWSAVAAWLRPEGLLLLVASLVETLVRSKLDKGVRSAARMVGLYAAITGPLYAFNFWLARSPFPNTFAAKMGTFGNLRGLFPFAAASELVNPLILLTIIVAAVTIIRGKKRAVIVHPTSWAPGVLTALLWSGLHFGAFWVLLPAVYQHFRYLIPLIPMACLGCETVLAYLPKPNVRLAVALLIFAVNLHQIPEGLGYLERETANIGHVQLAMALWLKDHAVPGQVIATDDIGLMSFESGHPILDLRGLADPGINTSFSATRGQLETILTQRHAGGLAIYPKLYPDFIARCDLEEVQTFAPPYPAETGAGPFVYYLWPPAIKPKKEAARAASQ